MVHRTAMSKVAGPSKRDTSEVDLGRSPQKRARKSVACQRCHAHKVKCSGGQPCARCRDAEGAPTCVYPVKDRQIKISSQYVDTILKDNERLRAGEGHTTSLVGSPATSLSAALPEAGGTQESARNPLFEDRPWFEPFPSQEMPIHINEAADAAFTTRFRQTLDSVYTSHIPRMSYVSDEHISQLSERNHSVWPNPSRARFLVKAAMSTICRYYHLVRKRAALDALEQAIQSNGHGNRLRISKLYALFALGELYSTKSPASESSFPGLIYFAKAKSLATLPAERPQLDTLEIVLLLAVYSFALNRRHSAISLTSSAIRLGTIMGMHLRIPDNQFRDRDAREHRTRLWWTAYQLDRNCSSMLGQPASIPDDDVQADLPSDTGLSEASRDDFEDAEYIVQQSELSRISAQTTSAIYSRRRYESPFSQRVQLALRNLTRWVESLPPHLRLEGNNDGKVTQNQLMHLHLRFNQIVILATRPILLHVLRCHRETGSLSGHTRENIPESVITIAGTCIQCSRHSYRLLSEAWIHGSFPTFEYFYTQYLFSAANSLAVSSFLGWNQSANDGELFDSAAALLDQLGQSGSYAGKEYCGHLDAMKKSMAKGHVQGPIESLPVSNPLPLSGPTYGNSTANTGSAITAGMALAEPSLQEFLAAPDLNLPLFEPPHFDGVQTSDWPELWDDEWTV